MPELPEAETIARTLAPLVSGRRIVRAEFHAKRVTGDSPEHFAGRRIDDVRRFGKQILLLLDHGVIHVKLGMTGALLVDRPATPYTRATFHLDTGGVLRFDDIRQFGSLRLLDAPPRGLGPDPIEIGAAEFTRRLRERNTTAKAALLNQAVVRGLGNIYTDEALHRAGIHPLARTRRLRIERAERLHREITALLEEAIAHRGSSISDYVDASGEKGNFQTRHRVYGREGVPCPQCGSLIEKIVVTQRGTHFCPQCQRR